MQGGHREESAGRRWHVHTLAWAPQGHSNPLSPEIPATRGHLSTFPGIRHNTGEAVQRWQTLEMEDDLPPATQLLSSGEQQEVGVQPEWGAGSSR